MIIGVDFDNTVVCYDGLFHQAGVDRKIVPPDIAASKEEVRDFLRQRDQEDCWTELQAYVYGDYIARALPFPGVLGFFRRCRRQRVPLFIISHKTRRPYLGPSFDLHAAARNWLEAQGFFDPEDIGLPPDHVFFEETKQAKLERIAATQCNLFVDDLPEFLGEADFPSHVERVLFDPHHVRTDMSRMKRIGCWDELSTLVWGSMPK